MLAALRCPRKPSREWHNIQRTLNIWERGNICFHWNAARTTVSCPGTRWKMGSEKELVPSLPHPKRFHRHEFSTRTTLECEYMQQPPEVNEWVGKGPSHLLPRCSGKEGLGQVHSNLTTLFCPTTGSRFIYEVRQKLVTLSDNKQYTNKTHKRDKAQVKGRERKRDINRKEEGQCVIFVWFFFFPWSRNFMPFMKQEWILEIKYM